MAVGATDRRRQQDERVRETRDEYENREAELLKRKNEEAKRA